MKLYRINKIINHNELGDLVEPTDTVFESETTAKAYCVYLNTRHVNVMYEVLNLEEVE